MIAVFRVTRSTTMPAIGAIRPYTHAKADPSKPSSTGVRCISRSRSGKTEKMAWRSA
jgi:hypothetical protein